MAKKLYWEYSELETDPETGEATGKVLLYKVSLTYSYLSGKAIINIDGTDFDISEKPFSLKKVEQMFRLGEMPALVSFNEKCVPQITVDNQLYPPKN